MNQPFVQSVFGSIAKAGFELLDRHTGGKPSCDRLIDLCQDLLSEKGEASGIALAWNVLETYQALDDSEKLKFFEFLESELSPNVDQIQLTLDEYKRNADAKSLEALMLAAEPRRQELIRRMNMAPEGIYALVSMRRDLLYLVKDHRHLLVVDNDFRALFASWFNRGFLILKRIDWKTPANILEKLIAYESVHAIQNWDDLRRRLARDRRCYAFYHPAFGEDEPLIFVEVALVDHLADNVQSLLNLEESIGDPTKANTAIFYSINNCQPGLKGISLGNFLIKQVVADLQIDLPNLKTFSTLSPIPGFVKWMKKKAFSDDESPIRDIAMLTLEKIESVDLLQDSEGVKQLESPIKKLSAHYLLEEKANDGMVLNPVARFHLGNGARLERINWMGDKSDNGLNQSVGLMVNYLYDLKHIEANHELFVKNNEVISSGQVKSLLK